MPFVSLLVVFFGVVAIIEEQHIFAPIINIVLSLPTDKQPAVSQVRSSQTDRQTERETERQTDRHTRR